MSADKLEVVMSGQGKGPGESVPDAADGVGATAGEPNTFEPEENPDLAAAPGGAEDEDGEPGFSGHS